MAEFVTVDSPDAEGVAVVRIARPPMNLFDVQVAREVADAVAAVATDPAVSALIVYGDERVFCAGDDMAELSGLAGHDPARAEALAGDLQRALACLGAVPQPTVAAIAGYGLGAGLELALGADRRIIGDNVKLGLPQIRAGLIPLAGIDALTRLIGASAAKDLVYSGRFVEAGEAKKLGLVDEVVAPDDVLAAARRWAGRFHGGPARALAAAKAVFASGADGAQRARTEWASLFHTEDARVGTASYLADGPGSAVFTGR